MTTRSISSRQRQLLSFLFALSCASCSAPTVTGPEPARQGFGASGTEPGPALHWAPEPVLVPTAQPAKAFALSHGEQKLERGINSYEEGAYKTAAKQLHSAIELGLVTKSDQVKAHKYLAFITCTSGQQKSCRAEFGKALDADPQFDLEPAEAGHPIWSAVLRSVRAERAGKAKRSSLPPSPKTRTASGG